MLPVPLITFETVLNDTPASAATSLMVTPFAMVGLRCALLFTYALPIALNRITMHVAGDAGGPDRRSGPLCQRRWIAVQLTGGRVTVTMPSWMEAVSLGWGTTRS